MNMNKKIIKGVAITAVAATIITTAGVNIATAANNKSTENNTVVTQAKNSVADLSAADFDDTAFKNETVYVMADATGATQNIIVSDWLQNKNGSLGLSDLTNLTDISNVKGYEDFALDGNKLTWNAEGNDIYYQGRSTAKLPVTVKVTYTLDGQEISPEELAGKSGKLTVRYEYTNNSKQTVKIGEKDEEIYTPFLMVSGCMLDSEKFKNVEVRNGKVLSDGQKEIVVGFSLPGLTESLKIDHDELTIPESFEYTADVTDCEIGTTLTVGLTDVFSDMDLEKDLNVSDIQAKVDELVDGSAKLADGCDALADAINTLKGKTGEFDDGVNTLANGLSEFSSHMKELKTGAAKLDEGASQLKDGLNSLDTNLGKAKAGVDQLAGSYGKLEAGIDQLAEGVKSAGTGIGQLAAGIEKTNETYGTLSKTVENDEQLIAALKQINAGYQDANIAAVIEKLEANTAGQKQIADGLTAAGSQLSEGVGSLQEGSSKLSGAVSAIDEGVGKLSEGTTTVKGAMDQLHQGSTTLYKGAKTLSEGTGSLVTNTGKLEEASNQLTSGGKKLVDASKQLNDGVSKLSDASVELKDGAKKLNDEGIQKINDLVSGDLQDIVDRFEAIVNASKDYKTYTSLGDNMDGNVKFVIKMEGTAN